VSPGTVSNAAPRCSTATRRPPESAPPESNQVVVVGVHAAGARLEGRVGGAADQLARDRVAAHQLALVLQLDLAGDRRQRGVDVGDARHDLRLAGEHRAPLGVRHHVLHHRDRHALRHARALVDALVGARLERDALDTSATSGGTRTGARRRLGVALRPRLLLRDRHPELDALRVVREISLPMRSLSGVMILPRAV
jgi:hypothetical protein